MLYRALRLLRTYHQINQQEMAKKLDVSNSYLSEIEKGLKSPTLDLLQKYSAHFKMPLSSILLFSEEIEGDRKPGSRLRVSAADKVLKLLEWLEDREAIADPQEKLSHR
jgi:transcriptional regulator with XRE-family HTH domain